METENQLKVFENNEFGKVRTLTIDGEPWFVGKDVAEILGYAKARNAIATHVDVEDKKDAPIQGTLGGTQSMIIINESGLYSLILSSKLPKAKEFKRWVTSEVLPSIRKTGKYETQNRSTMFSEELELKRLEYQTRQSEAKSKQEEIKMKRAELLMELSNRTDISEYKQIITSYAGNILMNKEILPLPELKEKRTARQKSDECFLYRHKKLEEWRQNII